MTALLYLSQAPRPILQPFPSSFSFPEIHSTFSYLLLTRPPLSCSIPLSLARYPTTQPKAACCLYRYGRQGGTGPPDRAFQLSQSATADYGNRSTQLSCILGQRAKSWALPLSEGASIRSGSAPGWVRRSCSIMALTAKAEPLSR